MTRSVDNAEEWFWCHVTKTDGCWLWTGRSVNFHGYGQIFWRGREQRTNRVAWELSHGPIPENLHVLHSCDVKACVRPSHLHLGTHYENMQEAAERGCMRSAQSDWQHCSRGHPFDESNTYVDPRGWRQCRRCHAERARKYREAKR